MFKKARKIMSLGLATTMLLVGCGGTGATTQKEDNSGTNTEATTEKKDEPVVIKFGSHAANDMDPNYKDPVTGEYAMKEEDRVKALAAMQKVKDELNVEIQWVQYPGDTTEVLLQSVMAGDPIADVVNLYTNSQAIILGQNVLRPLDDHADLIGLSEEGVPAKIYGKNYFMRVGGGKTHPLSPLFFNISYLEQVDALKVDGKTVYPTDLYKEGKWTWSVFEDYLAKIDAHFANSQGPERPEKRIQAYTTDYSETIYNAIHAAGGAVYGNDGLGVETQAVKDSVAFVQRLIDKKLLNCEVIEGTSETNWNFQEEPFKKGESVFVNLEDWRLGGSVDAAAARGQSIGFIPFPRPDGMAFDDPAYQQLRTGGESWGILRGVDEEKVPLAMKAFNVYWEERYKAEEDTLDQKPKINIPIDLFHPEIGADMEEIYYESTGRTVVNEFANMTGVYWPFVEIVGDSLYGANGSPKYDVAIQAKKGILEDKISSIEAVLNTTEVKDNIKPVFTEVEGTTPYAFAKGTDPATIKWNEKFTATDNVDGALDMAKATFDISATDFNTVGVYEDGVIGAIKDSVENERKIGLSIIIYDGTNKTAPTLTLKAEPRKIALDEDTSAINWAGDFVETAADKDGIDVKSNITADLSNLDASTAGTYVVPLTVVDFAGNKTTVEAKVIVE